MHYQHTLTTTTFYISKRISMTTRTPQPKLRRYLIARHGETNYNKERRVQGTVDEPCILTTNGTSQASALGMYIAKRQSGEVLDGDGKTGNDIAPPITQTWCSPLTRCKQTYAAISEVCSTYTNTNESSTSTLPTPIIHNNLHEIELCNWQNRLRQDIINEEPDNWNIFKETPKLLTLMKNGNEFRPVVDCWDRGLECWNTIRSQTARESDEDGAIVIMAHGAIGQCMLLQALGLSIDNYGKSRRYSFDNCECIEVEWPDDNNDNEEKHSCSVRWRRVHPDPDEWTSTLSSQKMGCSLSSSR